MADRYEVVRRESGALVRETRDRALAVGGVLGLFWAVEIVDRFLLGGALDGFGIQPRSLAGLAGIALAPFLHAGFAHLVANTLPFAILGFLSSSRRVMDYWVVSVVSAITAGIGVWLLGGAGTVTVGASSLVFGYLGFLMGRGIFERKVGTLLLSLAVTVLFGGMLWGILPLVAGVSWLGHLFGFLGGLWTASVLGREIRRKKGR